ncbi:hypothetical protein [Actinomadura rayongensis]|uniref:Uncharacterized protein n=1 Tax=Actinomadura rayongensis TaxID=1429076 RepID=A0A6I4WH73_9ACTN|nr:hypothetical protein [Actinomadura rayongensis]MXQ68210.1 hypothetical protein [Actinomadura rayongensis]
MLMNGHEDIRESESPGTASPGHAARCLRADLLNAYDSVGAAYQEAMRRAGLLTGMIRTVNALAGAQLRDVYTDAECEAVPSCLRCKRATACEMSELEVKRSGERPS